MSECKNFLNVGDVFAVVKKPYGELKITYWKVIEIKSRSHYKEDCAYSVIKCNKNGREFKDTNGFSTIIDSKIQKPNRDPATAWDVDYRLIKRGSEFSKKANLEPGLQIGKIKRRINYLKARIEKDKNELVGLVDRLVDMGG